MSTSRRALDAARRLRLISVTADAQGFLKAANERLLGRAVLDAERVATRQANNATDRAAWEAATVVDDSAVGRPGRPPGPRRRHAPPGPARRRHPHRRCRQLRGLGRARASASAGPGTFLGPTSGAMGYGLPAAIVCRARPSRPPVVALVGDGGLGMTLAELETAVRDGARVVVLVLRQRALRHDPDVAGPARDRSRRRDGARAGRLRGDRAGVRRARGPGRTRRRLRAGPADGPRGRRATVIQLALDRAWLSVDEHP